MPKTKYTESKVNFDDSSMYIFTDGITEIKDPNGEMLGSEGFKDYIKKKPIKIKQRKIKNYY